MPKEHTYKDHRVYRCECERDPHVKNRWWVIGGPNDTTSDRYGEMYCHHVRTLADARAHIDALLLRQQITELREALRNYLDAGLALQQAVGRIDGPELERLGLIMDWEMACLRHGQAQASLEGEA